MRFCHYQTAYVAAALLLGVAGSANAGVVNNAYVSAPVQQQTPIPEFTGRLLNERQEPVPGASITLVSSGLKFTSDQSGRFSFIAAPGDSLQITKQGYLPVSYRLTSTPNFELQFTSVNKQSGPPLTKDVELVFNKVSSNLAIASTDAVYSEDIVKSPVTSIRNAITGRIAGLLTTQFSGNPGADGVSATLRGQNPLIIIDGIPRNLTIFDLEEVESVTAIKDALGAAMLGVRGSNGALLITTKKGITSKQQISFTAQTAFQKPLNMPKPLSSFDYATLYNEALVNDGNTPAYSSTALDAYRTGSNPSLYPNVNWQDEVLKKSSRFDRYTLNARGGNSFARYYISLEHVNQTGLLKEDDVNKYSTNNSFKSYVVRSNVDVDINKKLSGGIYLLGRILNGNEPGSTTGSIFNSFLTTPNNASVVKNPNGTFGGNSQYQNNILAQSVNSGYRQNYKRDMLADFYLKRTLDEITPGLYVKAMVSFYATLSENILRNKSFAVFNMQVSPTNDTTYQQFGTDGVQANGNGLEYQGRSDYMELKLGYNKTFNGVHGVDVTLLANRLNSVDNSDLPYTSPGGSGRFAYNYKGKYIAEAAFGWNGSNRYPDNGRVKMGLFPAVGLGWVLSEEDFMNNVAAVSNLKVFGSYGKTGTDAAGYFSYIQRYFDGSATYFGTGAGSNTSIAEQPLANPNIDFEKANKLNVGVTGSFLKNRLSFTAEYYNNKYYDLMMQRGRNTAILGNTYPNENIGEQRYTGTEFQLDWQDQVREFSYYASANAAFQNSKVLYIDEVFRPYDWMKRTGNVVGQQYGYIADGFFQSTDEVTNHPSLDGYTPQLGDIKYKDLNADGVINQFDQAPLYTDKPVLILGLSTGFAWKGVDFSLLVQGVQNRKIYLSGNGYFEFQNSGAGQAYEHHMNRWTPATATTADYPRLSIGSNVNNQAFSSFWARDASYMRLKNIELGYTLPASWTTRIKLQSARLFINGTNLLTLTPLEDIDPEVYNGAIPIQKLVNFGLTIKL